jgi:hypothetical protein
MVAHPSFEIYTSTICSSQSTHAILTVRVALTDIPQQGQIYFLVLDVLGGVTVPLAPLCAPLPPPTLK